MRRKPGGAPTKGRQGGDQSADHSPGPADPFIAQDELAAALRSWSDRILDLASEEAFRRGCPQPGSEDGMMHAIHILDTMQSMVDDSIEKLIQLNNNENLSKSEEMYVGMLARLGLLSSCSMLALALITGTDFPDEIRRYLYSKAT